jgi:hypothetical protein
MHYESSVLARPVLAITARIVSVFVPRLRWQRVFHLEVRARLFVNPLPPRIRR